MTAKKTRRTGVAPRHRLVVLDVEEVYHERVAGLGALDGDRSRQVVDLGEVDVGNIVGIVRVLRGSAGSAMAREGERLVC
jgi:hypothetical protein